MVIGKEIMEKEQTISYDDFSKLEMQIGEILSAEKIEGATRLLKLQVGFGDFQRQIVSGIAEFYTPEDLIGKKCPFLVNLEPRTIRGVESQGMILAIDPGDGSAVLLHPDKDIPSGSIVR